MNTAVMTDSNSGITEQEAESMGIFLIPMPVIIDGEIYYEGKNLDQKTFYSSLTGGRNVTTSQPSPGDVMGMWDKILLAGYDELVYLPMSSGLSNSCETAIRLSEEYNGKVRVVDNHRISVTLRESVMDAKSLADTGASAGTIKERLEAQAYDASIYIAVDTLEFLKKGGRVTPAGAAIGSILNIKPILTIQGEKLDAFAKVRGIKKCKSKMMEAIRQELNTRFKDIDPDRLIIATAGAGLTQREEEEWKTMVEEAFEGIEVYYNPLSFSIGSHVGPGAIGTAICVRHRAE